jgi:hypothetical protein
MWGAIGSLALLGSVTVAAQAVTSSTPASAAGNVTRAVIGSTTGDPLGKGAFLKFDSLSMSRSGETLTIDMHSVGQDWKLVVRPKTGSSLHLGPEIFTANVPTGARAGLELTGNVGGEVRQCPGTSSGSYDIRALGGSSVAMDFEIGCDGIAGNPVMGGWLAVEQPPGAIDPVNGGDLVAIQPTRVFDTRVGWGGPLQQGESRAVTVAGSVATGGRVPEMPHVMAVVLNVTAVAPTADTHVAVYPTDAPGVPGVSNLNVTPNQVVPNLVTVKVGPDGRVNLYNFQGQTNVIVDVVGYFAPDVESVPGGSRFRPQNPLRVLDTRDGHGPLQPQQPIAVGVTKDPNVTAVALNVTVAGARSFGYVTVYPPNEAAPLASNLNYAPGDVVPNLVVAKVVGGQVNIVTDGSTDIVVDVVGEFTSDRSTGAGRFVPRSPERKFDTRQPGQCPPLQGGGVCDLGIVGQIGLYPLEVSGLVFNATVTNTTADSYLTFWPSALPRPLASNLNWRAGETRPNLVMMGPDVWGFDTAFNAFGSTDLIVDVAGWFTA